MSLEQGYSPAAGGLVIKFDPQDAFFKFPVVDDSDIFHIDRIGCQNRGNGGDRTGFIGNVAVNAEGFLDEPCGTVRHGIAVASGMAEHFINSVFLFLVDHFLGL